jgi:Phosphotransferase enzyme family
VTTAPDTTDPSVVASILRRNDSLDLLLHGDEFDTWQVGRNIVVKFPTNEVDAAKVPLELALDALVRRSVGDLMPEIVLVGEPSADFPWPYLGYAAASGIQGQRTDGVTIAPGVGLVGSIGSFLERLHEIDEREAHAAGIGDRIVSYERPSMTQATMDATTRIAGDAVARFFLAPPPSPEVRHVLCHTDLKGEHLFVDRSRSRLTAVIDWADAEVSDPAVDLAGIVGWLGPSVARDVVATSGSQDARLTDRAIWLARAGILKYWNLIVSGDAQAPLPVIESQLRAAFAD